MIYYDTRCDVTLYDMIWYYKIYQRTMICIVLDIHAIVRKSFTKYHFSPK